MAIALAAEIHRADGAGGLYRSAGGLGGDGSGASAWTVYGLLRTADSVSPLSFRLVIASGCAILLIYGTVFYIGLRYLLRYANRETRVGEPGPAPEMAPGGKQ